MALHCGEYFEYLGRDLLHDRITVIWRRPDAARLVG